MGWLRCFCEQMGPWELEEKEENFFWLIRLLSQHLWAYLVKQLCLGTFLIPQVTCLRGS